MQGKDTVRPYTKRMPEASDRGGLQGKDAVRQFAMMMPAASDNGSQPYSRAFRHREMAGKSDTHTRNLAFR